MSRVRNAFQSVRPRGADRPATSTPPAAVRRVDLAPRKFGAEIESATQYQAAAEKRRAMLRAQI